MSVSEILKDPEQIAEEVGLPERVGSYASELLEQLEEEGYEIPADARTYPAIVYVAARDEGVPVTAAEIAEAAGVQETAVGREFNRLTDTLPISPTHPGIEAFVDRFAEDLNASEETVEVARDLLREGQNVSLFQNKTRAVAGAICLYAASRITEGGLTQKQFEKFGVSRTSIRKGYRGVLSLREENPPDAKLVPEVVEGRLHTSLDDLHESLDEFPEDVRETAGDLLSQFLRATVEADGTDTGREWVVGKSPDPIAAAVYWIAAGENRINVLQAELADAANVHKVTISRRTSVIREVLEREGAIGTNG